ATLPCAVTGVEIHRRYWQCSLRSLSLASQGSSLWPGLRHKDFFLTGFDFLPEGSRNTSFLVRCSVWVFDHSTSRRSRACKEHILNKLRRRWGDGCLPSTG